MKEILAAINFTTSAELMAVIAMLVIGGSVLAGQFILWLLGIE